MLGSFDEQRIGERLQVLSPHLGIAFGTACANRSLAGYAPFTRATGWGDVRPLEAALAYLWTLVEGAQRSPTTLRDHLAACEAAIPGGEEFDSAYTFGAQEAVFSICNVLDFCLSENFSDLVLAARSGTDSVDSYVQTIEALGANEPHFEQRIRVHPLMQQELARQQRDLDALEAFEGKAISGLVSRRDQETLFAVRT